MLWSSDCPMGKYLQSIIHLSLYSLLQTITFIFICIENQMKIKILNKISKLLLSNASYASQFLRASPTNHANHQGNELHFLGSRNEWTSQRGEFPEFLFGLGMENYWQKIKKLKDPKKILENQRKRSCFPPFAIGFMLLFVQRRQPASENRGVSNGVFLISL